MAEGRKLIKLKPEEAALIVFLRRLEYGSLEIEVKDQIPTIGVEPKKTVNFKKMAELEGLTGELFGEVVTPIKKASNQ